MTKWLIEYLPRIGNISIIIESSQGKKIHIDAIDLDGIHAKVGGEPIRIPFAAKVTLIYNKEEEETLCSQEFNEVAHFKLQYSDLSTNKNSISLMNDDLNWKWSKKELLAMKNFSFGCIDCGNVIFESDDNCRKLNIMPSEFWAELMDNWHCHKPSENNDSEGNNLNASFLKYSQLKPNNFEILIGNSFFICNSATLNSKVIIDSKLNIVGCKNCNSIIGEINQDKLCQIFKWKLLLNGEDKYPIYKHVISQILNIVDSTSSRHILLQIEDSTEQIYIWAFSINTMVAATNYVECNNSIKILYKDFEDDADLNFQIKNTNVEKIITKLDAFKAFVEYLSESNSNLPSTVKTWGKWKVSYLPI
ncbi:hypothetical protein TPHA_0B00320 [Tetrapisispora phaffii CBS 4417]|uniref:E3 ubiquitin-protein ligase E3D n=1 Tax=Tetrapisispora phaffii (strain ATCC 24235 / CBS 4417 / NBRC 1672 / NRRL Y-8282 / UCD 70-5) TaxID=1071381 RepID=G8BQA7_TETPH|nr:hypothetical protein TPHA_0B00320 [Tetrapisispora phaffii CBS 4417]CCE61704.1 hypothetical protein TPHA_0B00320 [Tetrapisispora phaffii CBS 4417]